MALSKRCNRKSKSKSKNRGKFVGSKKANLRGSVERWQMRCPATVERAKQLGISLIVHKKDGHKRLKNEKELKRDIKKSK